MSVLGLAELERNWEDGWEEEVAGACGFTGIGQAGCVVPTRKGVSRRKPMASLQSSVNCSHNPGLVFQVSQELEITLRQLSSELKGFRV